jgi:sigma-B regulation protein RsbU (phosphoserine phosphatase)
MRIRWKLLLILLCISLLPVIIMRWNGQQSMRELGEDLAGRTREVLIRKTSRELGDLVDEHATILRRERDLVELALQVQASELEKIFSDQNSRIDIPKTLPSQSRRLSAPGTAPAKRKLFGKRTMMGSKTIEISYNKQSYWIPANLERSVSSEMVNTLSRLLPVYRSLSLRHRDLILWQLTVFDNGTTTIYPAIENMPMLPRKLLTKLYRPTEDKTQIMWSRPEIDPITNQLVFIVSTPFFQSNGENLGVTAIAVPVDTLLKEDDHIGKLSENIISLIARPERQSVSGNNAIRIIAREQQGQDKLHHHHWQALLKEEWLNIKDERSVNKIITDLQQGKTGVTEVFYLEKESLLAYGAVDDYQTALLVIVPKSDIVAEAVSMETYVLDRIDRLIKVTSLILSVVIAAVIVVALILSRSVTKSISRLANAARQVANGDFSARVQINSRDEMGELGHTFNQMVPALEERVMMKQDLNLAMEVQQNLLPKKVPPLPGMDIAGISIYCDETGGDYYDFLDVGRHNGYQLGVAVGDVSGHGIQAALLMATVRAFLKSRVKQSGSIAEVISDINRLVAVDASDTGQFMTLFYMEIEPHGNGLHWVRAGHDPALLYDPEDESFKELKGKGIALGVDSGSEYHGQTISGLSQGQVILIGTDGLWEIQNKSGEMFGKQRLKRLIKQNAHLPSDEIVAAIIEGLQSFNDSAKQADDITLVVIKIDESNDLEAAG